MIICRARFARIFWSALSNPLDRRKRKCFEHETRLVMMLLRGMPRHRALRKLACGGTKLVEHIASLFLGQQIRPVGLLCGDDAGRARSGALMKEL